MLCGNYTLKPVAVLVCLYQHMLCLTKIFCLLIYHRGISDVKLTLCLLLLRTQKKKKQDLMNRFTVNS